MAKNIINIIVADDSPEFIEGLQVMFATSDKYKIIETLRNGQELTDSNHLNKADLILTDIEMPILNGIDAGKRINFQYPNLPMIAITMYKDKVYLEEIIGAGFKGFIYKPDLADSLFNVIDSVLKNNFSFQDSNLKLKN